MKELTLYPADLAGMTVAQLAAAPIQDFLDAERNVDEAIAFLKPLRAKLDAAKLQRFGEQARTALRDSGRDFGTAHVNDGALHVKYELPKKVTWSQTILKEMAERIVASGDKVEDYIDVKLSVSASRTVTVSPSATPTTRPVMVSALALHAARAINVAQKNLLEISLSLSDAR